MTKGVHNPMPRGADPGTQAGGDTAGPHPRALDFHLCLRQADPDERVRLDSHGERLDPDRHVR